MHQVGDIVFNAYQIELTQLKAKEDLRQDRKICRNLARSNIIMDHHGAFYESNRFLVVLELRTATLRADMYL